MEQSDSECALWLKPQGLRKLQRVKKFPCLANIPFSARVEPISSADIEWWVNETVGARDASSKSR